MKVLVVGGGGREHALVDAVARSARNPEIFCAPGNAGTAQLAENLPIVAENSPSLIAAVKKREIDLTIVGPEAPLCAGIVDQFQQAGLRIFGPNKVAARLEGDKAWCKEMLVEAGAPTARAKVFTQFRDAKEFLTTRDTPQVVKASGLAGGKGVIVCDDPADAIVAAEEMLVQHSFGDAGRRIVVEEKLIGDELSVHALIDGDTIYILESSQDHKRAHDGDTGLNTGGMGAYSPAPGATDEVLDMVQSEVLVPMLDTLRRHGIHYKGVLYAGLMLTAGGPKVLEFNCRFGDPEAQVILPRLRSDILDVIDAVIDGRLDEVSLDWDERCAVCVVLASAGYPGSYEKGKVISGLAGALAMEGVSVNHAGTRERGNSVVTNGGRVLGVTGLGSDVRAARDLAYAAADRIDFEGKFLRRDIGHRAL